MKHRQIHIPLLILSVSVTAVVAVLYAYMFYATSASVHQANLARDIVRVEGLNQSQAKSLSNLAASTTASRAQLNSFFVPADNVVVFITTLESLGPKSGGTISIASIDADSLAGMSAGTIGAARARVGVRGSWASIMRALSLAERLPYAVSIDHVVLNVSNVEKKQQTWNLSFDIEVAIIVPISKS